MLIFFAQENHPYSKVSERLLHKTWKHLTVKTVSYTPLYCWVYSNAIQEFYTSYVDSEHTIVYTSSIHSLLLYTQCICLRYYISCYTPCVYEHSSPLQAINVWRHVIQTRKCYRCPPVASEHILYSIVTCMGGGIIICIINFLEWYSPKFACKTCMIISFLKVLLLKCSHT